MTSLGETAPWRRQSSASRNRSAGWRTRACCMGSGRYTDDIVLPGMLHGVVLRSPHAAARIEPDRHRGGSIAAGVKAIYTAADLNADGIGPLPCAAPVREPRRLDAWRCRRIRCWRTARCAMSAIRWRSSSPTPPRRRATRPRLVAVDYEILPSITDLAKATRQGRAAGLARGAAQHRVRLGDRRQGGDRGAVRQGRACHAADGGEQPHRRLLDGGARRDGRLRCGDRPLDAVCQHPGRLAGEEPDRRRCSTPIRKSSASSRPMSAAASA